MIYDTDFSPYSSTWQIHLSTVSTNLLCILRKRGKLRWTSIHIPL